MQWTVLLPAKAMPGAKSRLAASGDPAAHEALVAALRADTLSAARAALGVARIVLVTDRVAPVPAGVDEVVVQSEPGLNPALREAAGQAAGRWPTAGIAALVGDLPALNPGELAAALALAAAEDRSFVADHTDLGTTLLAARPGSALDPSFGPGSAAAHRAGGATPIPGDPGLRQDVDTPADLLAALDLGVGPATLAVTASTQLRVHLGSA